MKKSPLEREVEGSLRYSSGLGNQENEIRDEHGAGGIKSAGARESADKHREPAFRLFELHLNFGVSATSTRGVASACAKAIRDPLLHGKAS